MRISKFKNFSGGSAPGPPLIGEGKGRKGCGRAGERGVGGRGEGDRKGGGERREWREGTKGARTPGPEFLDRLTPMHGSVNEKPKELSSVGGFIN